MKKFCTVLFLMPFLSLQAFSQQDIKTSEQIIVSGDIKSSKVISLAELKGYSDQEIPDLVITNHMGEKRGELHELKGVLVKDVLKDLEYSVDSPRYLSEFYFTFMATDDYTVVFSWNELFNSPTGDHTFLVTEANGDNLEKMEDRILLICTSDFKTGRRHVKSLDRMIVSRVN